ncbi:hypothetical protein [Paenibacillus alginolyticus]|uniref:hypothetical protein n=1 Tax=Paenibacillus alginolyticus TaxID=59839 RepID=UPI000492CC62|nr:hypothetical protein [Paenibacillus alginolyticus]
MNVIAADTDEEVKHLGTKFRQQFLKLSRGNELSLQPPVESMDSKKNMPCTSSLALPSSAVRKLWKNSCKPSWTKPKLTK